MSEYFNNKLKDISESILESGIQVGSSIVGEVFINGVIGSFAPGVVMAAYSYKQKRHERNLIELIEQLNKRINLEIQERWDSLKPDRKAIIKERFAGIVADYVIDEKEPSKIHYLANGFISTFTIDETLLNDDMIIEYYDILEKLRLIELRMLIDIYTGTLKIGDPMFDSNKYRESHDVTNSDMKYIIEKMTNLNLLVSDREEQYDRFNRKLLEGLNEGKSFADNRRPNKLRLPVYFSHRISPLGKRVVYFFTQIAKE